MKSSDIEVWALRIIDNVRSRQPIEDSRVEVKGGFPSPSNIARDIAGHANAARGEPILWLMGVDEKQGVRGVDAQEISNWYAQLKAEFNGLAPEVMPVNVPIDDKMVVALLFDTQRAPYVVRNIKYGSAGGGPVKYEVPWRDGNATRTAARSDLIRVLVPGQRLPGVDVVDCSLGSCKQNPSSELTRWFLKGHLFVVPRTSLRLVIPFYRCSASLNISQNPEQIAINQVTFSAPRRHISSLGLSPSLPVFGSWETDSATIFTTESEAIIDGPGTVLLQAEGWTDNWSGALDDLACARVRIVFVDAPGPLSLEMRFQLRTPKDDPIPTWEMESFFTNVTELFR